ncbi:MAG: hypothetical protein RH917_20300 [Lacipirellulaceae bacterium]
MKMKRTLPVVLVASVGVLFFRPWQSESETEEELPTTQTNVETESVSDTSIERTGPLICPGTWKQKPREDDSGRRYLKVESDGVGELIIQLDGTQKLVIGSGETVVDTTWRVEDETITFKLTGGKPESAYKRLLALALEEETTFVIRSAEPKRIVLEHSTEGDITEWNLQGDPLCYEKTRTDEE